MAAKKVVKIPRYLDTTKLRSVHARIALVEVYRRLVEGEAKYSELDLLNDTRVWGLEKMEEGVDYMQYSIFRDIQTCLRDGTMSVEMEEELPRTSRWSE